MRARFFSLALLTTAATAAAQPAPLSPDWIAGYWLSCDNGAQVAENWLGAGTGTLLGTNFTQGEQASYEFLRVAANGRGGISYYSMPNGAPVTEFTMTSNENRRAVFENPAHDFPQRVIYWRDGGRLHARIEGEISGRLESQDWTFRRSRPDQNCPR
ncbi:MAG: DUF6265 family protein [Terricaulis sp.]